MVSLRWSVILPLSRSPASCITLPLWFAYRIASLIFFLKHSKFFCSPNSHGRDFQSSIYTLIPNCSFLSQYEQMSLWAGVVQLLRVRSGFSCLFAGGKSGDFALLFNVFQYLERLLHVLYVFRHVKVTSFSPLHLSMRFSPCNLTACLIAFSCTSTNSTVSPSLPRRSENHFFSVLRCTKIHSSLVFNRDLMFQVAFVANGQLCTLVP